jgi:hypothetical protein
LPADPACCALARSLRTSDFVKTGPESSRIELANAGQLTVNRGLVFTMTLESLLDLRRPAGMPFPAGGSQCERRSAHRGVCFSRARGDKNFPACDAVNQAKNAHLSKIAFVGWKVETDTATTVASIIAGVWTIGPPIWFFAEYFWWAPYWYRRHKTLPSIEAFKHSQELARNFWIAGVAVLLETHPAVSANPASGPRRRAKARGQSLGRPFKLTDHQKREAIKRRNQSETLAEIARSYNVSPATISRLIP